jgi:hypothetical protein
LVHKLVELYQQRFCLLKCQPPFLPRLEAAVESGIIYSLVVYTSDSELDIAVL